jgi:PiT family inorganic phosphate transporter
MSDTTLEPAAHGGHHENHGRPDLDAGGHIAGVIVFLAVLAFGLFWTLRGLMGDIDESHTPALAIGAFVLLAIALVIALGFEFVNGFHDTANAVATVIYTRSLKPQIAVVFSGTMNFLGVLTSSGAVAFAIVSLLPVELILQVGQGSGFAMIFALLIAAILWNLGTWAMGLPASSSHTLIGSIIGVGIANQLMADDGTATSGVDWMQAMGVFRALLLSPLIGFTAAATMLIVMKLAIKDKRLYSAPATNAPPPVWIRGLLCLTCGAVSFAHGSNDGQKGMGLIMLILIGALPTAYALNRAVPESHMAAFVQASDGAQKVWDARSGNLTFPTAAARGQVTDALKLKKIDDKVTYAALGALTGDIVKEVQGYGSLNKVPAAAVQNIRNEMFMVSEAVRVLDKQKIPFG